MNPLKDIITQLKSFLYGKNALSRLLQANIAVFVLVGILNLFFYLYKIPEELTFGKYALSKVASWFAVPSDVSLLIQKPWTLFTYMFLHYNFLHILFNMLMLYFGGTMFMHFLGQRKLVFTYIMGGISGALIYIIAFNSFPVFSEITPYSVAMGASASVLAILIAIATYTPDYVVHLLIFGRIKLKHVALALIIIDLFSIDGKNPGGHIAHLGGALWGFLYVLALRNRRIVSITHPIGVFLKRIFKTRPKLRVEYKKRTVTDEEYNKQRAERQKNIDIILDKIKISGYNSLSAKEKEILFSESNRNKTNQ